MKTNKKKPTTHLIYIIVFITIALTACNKFYSKNELKTIFSRSLTNIHSGISNKTDVISILGEPNWKTTCISHNWDMWIYIFSSHSHSYTYTFSYAQVYFNDNDVVEGGMALNALDGYSKVDLVPFSTDKSYVKITSNISGLQMTVAPKNILCDDKSTFTPWRLAVIKPKKGKEPTFVLPPGSHELDLEGYAYPGRMWNPDRKNFIIIVSTKKDKITTVNISCAETGRRTFGGYEYEVTWEVTTQE